MSLIDDVSFKNSDAMFDHIIEDYRGRLIDVSSTPGVLWLLLHGEHSKDLVISAIRVIHNDDGTLSYTSTEEDDFPDVYGCPVKFLTAGTHTSPWRDQQLLENESLAKAYKSLVEQDESYARHVQWSADLAHNEAARVYLESDMLMRYPQMLALFEQAKGRAHHFYEEWVHQAFEEGEVEDNPPWEALDAAVQAYFINRVMGGSLSHDEAFTRRMISGISLLSAQMSQDVVPRARQRA